MNMQNGYGRIILPALLCIGAGLARAGEPLYTMEDLHFLHHMSVHHQQAVDMSELVPTRSDREEFHRYASFVKRAQAAEIDYMHSLMDLAEQRGQAVDRSPVPGDPPMHGMLSSAYMHRLESSSGAEFEKLWLEGMIYHHQGAIDMSQQQQQHQLDTGHRPYGLAVLVEDILMEQRYEITKMHRWLREWGLVDTAVSVDDQHQSIMQRLEPPSTPAHHAH